MTRYEVANEILRFDNRDRYIAQSAATTVNCHAELPRRDLVMFDANPPSEDEIREAFNFKYGLGAEAR